MKLELNNHLNESDAVDLGTLLDASASLPTRLESLRALLKRRPRSGGEVDQRLRDAAQSETYPQEIVLELLNYYSTRVSGEDEADAWTLALQWACLSPRASLELREASLRLEARESLRRAPEVLEDLMGWMTSQFESADGRPALVFAALSGLGASETPPLPSEDLEALMDRVGDYITTLHGSSTLMHAWSTPVEDLLRSGAPTSPLRALHAWYSLGRASRGSMSMESYPLLAKGDAGAWLLEWFVRGLLDAETEPTEVLTGLLSLLRVTPERTRELRAWNDLVLWDESKNQYNPTAEAQAALATAERFGAGAASVWRCVEACAGRVVRLPLELGRLASAWLSPRELPDGMPIPWLQTSSSTRAFLTSVSERMREDWVSCLLSAATRGSSEDRKAVPWLGLACVARLVPSCVSSLDDKQAEQICMFLLPFADALDSRVATPIWRLLRALVPRAGPGAAGAVLDAARRACSSSRYADLLEGLAGTVVLAAEVQASSPQSLNETSTQRSSRVTVVLLEPPGGEGSGLRRALDSWCGRFARDAQFAGYANPRGFNALVYHGLIPLMEKLGEACVLRTEDLLTAAESGIARRRSRDAALDLLGAYARATPDRAFAHRGRILGIVVRGFKLRDSPDDALSADVDPKLDTMIEIVDRLRRATDAAWWRQALQSVERASPRLARAVFRVASEA